MQRAALYLSRYKIFFFVSLTMLFACAPIAIPFFGNLTQKAEAQAPCTFNGSCTLDDLSDSCQSSGKCVGHDNTALDNIRDKCASGDPMCTAEVAQAINSIGQRQTEQRRAAEGSCGGVVTGIDWNCVWKSVMSWFGSWFLTIGGSILLVAGTVFDWFMKLLVVEFAKTIQDLQLMDGLKRGWTLIRDVANIAIIGVFVFVAIMTILGSAEYGAKRLVARVLVVSVLINFSFLFSQVIIEGTNFVSAQFWKGMPASVQTQGTAQSFLKTFGMEDVWAQSKLLTDAAAEESNSGGVAFFYGLFAGIFLIAISAVLLYGSYVIVARALLLVITMLTSALAFGTFLVPRWSGQNFIGWDSWWSNLLKASLFGPLLMMFLWITMTIIGAAQLQARGAGAAIGALADDPSKMTSPTAWGSIILLILGTGLLFVAIRSAGSFASSIGGFGIASSALGMISRFGIAPLGRQTLGFAGAYHLKDLERRREQALMKGNQPLADRLNNQINFSKQYGLGSMQKRDFNLANTAAAKMAATLGMGGLLAGEKKVGGFIKQAETNAKEAAEKAKGLVLSKDKATEGIEKQLTKSGEQNARQLEKLQDTAKQQLQTTRAESEKTRGVRAEEHKKALADHKQETAMAQEIEKKFGEQIERLTKEVASTGSGVSKNKLEAVRSQRESEMRGQADRIEKARVQAEHLERLIENPAEVQKARQDLEKAQAALTKHEKEIKEKAKEQGEQIAKDTMKHAADYAAKESAGFFRRDDGMQGEMGREAFTKAFKSKGLKDRLKAWKELETEEGDKGGSGDKKEEKH